MSNKEKALDDQRPVVKISYTWWSVDCENCGVIDEGLSKSKAQQLATRHRQRHCAQCGDLLPYHTESCTLSTEGKLS
jgi:uncharacterized membrane protein